MLQVTQFFLLCEGKKKRKKVWYGDSDSDEWYC